jgi:Nse4 C-terminal
VRDGFLGLKKIEDEPHVYLFDPDPISHQSQRGHASDTVQCVMSLDTGLWKEKIEKYQIQSALLKLDSHQETEAMEEDSD